MIVVGDQWLKDGLQVPLARLTLWGANMLGAVAGIEDNGSVNIYSVLLAPQGTHDHPVVKYLQRPFVEKPILASMGLGNPTGFPAHLTLAAEYAAQRSTVKSR